MKTNLIFLLLAVCLIGNVIADEQLTNICGGDEESVIQCIGDEELSTLGFESIETSIITDETGGGMNMSSKGNINLFYYMFSLGILCFLILFMFMYSKKKR